MFDVGDRVVVTTDFPNNASITIGDVGIIKELPTHSDTYYHVVMVDDNKFWCYIKEKNLRLETPIPVSKKFNVGDIVVLLVDEPEGATDVYAGCYGQVESCKKENVIVKFPNNTYFVDPRNLMHKHKFLAINPLTLVAEVLMENSLKKSESKKGA